MVLSSCFVMIVYDSNGDKAGLTEAVLYKSHIKIHRLGMYYDVNKYTIIK